MQNAILTLRGRLAWAHDFNADRNVTALFQTLPGTTFVVNGAAQAHDSALITASAENEMAERLVGGGDPGGPVLQRHQFLRRQGCYALFLVILHAMSGKTHGGGTMRAAITLTTKDLLPEDGTSGTLVGRAWLPRQKRPCGGRGSRRGASSTSTAPLSDRERACARKMIRSHRWVVSRASASAISKALRPTRRRIGVIAKNPGCWRRSICRC